MSALLKCYLKCADNIELRIVGVVDVYVCGSGDRSGARARARILCLFEIEGKEIVLI